jgi:uncharacterized protein YbjT (DUF2867 family)
MAGELYVITGATGNVGGAAAERLLARKAKVRVVGRSADRLKALAAKGAQPFVGSLNDRAAMRRAFDGATGAFVLIPPDPQAANFRAYQTKIADTLAEAVLSSRVPYVVTLSSVGAELPSGTGPIAGLHEMEQKLNTIASAHVMHLRAAYFLENHLWMIGAIKHAGIYPGAWAAELPVGMIATRDIGAEVARLLTERNWRGKSVHDLSGQRDVTMAEAARVLGAAIGKPDLRYVQVPYEEAEKGAIAVGIGASLAALYTEMTRAFNEGRIRPMTPRSPATTTPTSIEEFAGTFAAAYGAA